MADEVKGKSNGAARRGAHAKPRDERRRPRLFFPGEEFPMGLRQRHSNKPSLLKRFDDQKLGK
jgi:hypothetical protein